MKIPLTYGLGIAIAGAIVALVQFLLGYHSDPAKFAAGQAIGNVTGLVITVVGLTLGLRAVREATPDGSLSYGRAVGNGTLIGLFAGLCGLVFYLLYGKVINPQFHELIYQTQIDKMSEQGMSQQQIDDASGMIRFFTGPIWLAIMAFFLSVIASTLLSLLIALFVKRPPTRVPAPVTA